MRLVLLAGCLAVLACPGIIWQATVQGGSGKGVGNERILYGKEASNGQFPFMALTLLAGEYSKVTKKITLCGGALIAKRWVISAAHCLNGSTPTINVILGSANRLNKTGTLTFYIPKSCIFVHPKFIMNQPSTPDLVLYHLPSPACCDKQHPNISSLALSKSPANSVAQYDHANVTTLGWGITESGESSSILRFTTLKVLAHRTCMRKYPEIAKAFICTEKKTEFTGPCPGDSGGPLIANGTNGKPELIGITSHSKAHEACFDPKSIDVYTYVPFHTDWIRKTMSENS